jgi:hypothetical protein
MNLTIRPQGASKLPLYLKTKPTEYERRIEDVIKDPVGCWHLPQGSNRQAAYMCVKTSNLRLAVEPQTGVLKL